MASVGGVNSGNMTSLYGNRNVLSGLATGMDTESMIMNSVSGIRMKISTLGQQQTKLQWKQEAYQNLTNKMVEFSRKYTSYTSSTNLLSSSFFSRSVTTTASGANASKVSATGRANSSVQLNGVAQLASATRYQVSSGGVLDQVASDGGRPLIEAGSSMDLAGTTEVSNLAGMVTIRYGTQNIAINFKSDEKFASADDFAKAIERELANQDIALTGGGSKKANEMIKVENDGGKITFSDKAGGNSVFITGMSGDIAKTFENEDFSNDAKTASLDLSGADFKFTRDVTTMEQLSGKQMSFTLDGMNKKITIPTQDELAAYQTANPGSDLESSFTALMQQKLDRAFGTGKVVISDQDSAGNGYKARFSVTKGSHLTVSSDVSGTFGLNQSESTSLNLGRTLGQSLTNFDDLVKSEGKLLKAVGKVHEVKDDGIVVGYKDDEGNAVNAAGERIGRDGKALYGVDLTINGKVVGSFHRDTALDSVMLAINSDTDAGVSVNYSKMTNEFIFSSKQTGEGFDIKIEGNLGEALFGAYDATKLEAGKDAIVNMTVNGSNLTLRRSSNTFDVDGMSITVNGTFNGSVDASGKESFDFLDASGTLTDPSLIKDPVGFTTAADADKIVTAIKSMVEDYNAMLKDIREAFATLPAQKANKAKYEPLTDEDRESMSESAVEAYEEKAKQGLLFGDQDLSAMYDKLLSAITPSGNDRAILNSIGLTTDYSNGLSSLTLDENKLRDMLKTNPDTVTSAFTKVAGNGTGTDGIMQKLKSTLDTYSATEGQKGILINKAGSKYAVSTMLKNSIKSQIDAVDEQITRWQDKLATKVDYYTRQFTRLEQLTAQMNSQSSTLMGMMMGGQ